MLTPAPTAGNTEWFVHDRFGMFIHWGLYALAARHEWVKSHERSTTSTYQQYFEHFDPDLYDPRAWAAAAKAAGMKYVVLTAKHHEGFCLWDTQQTDYKATNTPYGKDLLEPFVEAFRAEGLRVGFYYSLIDWHHPDFPIDVCHPLRDREDVAELNQRPRHASAMPRICASRCASCSPATARSTSSGSTSPTRAAIIAACRARAATTGRARSCCA